MFIEFKDPAYSVVEDDLIYEVTIVKQGEPQEEIVVSIFPIADPTAFDTADCKRTTIYLKVAVILFLVYKR